MTVFPFLWGTPEWVSPHPGGEPVANARQRRIGASFCVGPSERYGPAGEFWRENRGLPCCRSAAGRSGTRRTSSPSPSNPIRAFRELIGISGRLLHRADPGSTGDPRRPLRAPAADSAEHASGAFLSQLYRVAGIKTAFDGVALHPYVADAGAMRSEIENLRRGSWSSPRRCDADLRDRAGLGLGQLRVALGARAASGRRANSIALSRSWPAIGGDGGSAASGGSRGPTRSAPVSSATPPACSPPAAKQSRPGIASTPGPGAIGARCRGRLTWRCARL